jgi:hypothetical protein
MNNERQKLREIIERATATSDAANDDPPREFDAETASLRQYWLQLGKLIEEDILASGSCASSDFASCDCAGDARSCNAHFASERVENRDYMRSAPSAARRRPARSFWLTAAVAGSLLVATGVALAVRILDGAHKPEANSRQIAGIDNPITQPAATAVLPERQPKGDSLAAVAPPSPARRLGSGTGATKQIRDVSEGGETRSGSYLPVSSNPKLVPPMQAPRHDAAAGDRLPWGDSVDDEISAVGQATIYARQNDGAQASRVWEIQTGLDQLNREVEHGTL